jgi:hypothetical protein
LNLDKRFRFNHDEKEVMPKSKALAPKYKFFSNKKFGQKI